MPTPYDQQPRLALLIDSDNISSKYLTTILSELPKHGIATYRRIYGDFTDPQAASWRKMLLDNAIIPVQQYSNVKSRKPGETAGKNATDSALIIDAMDILYAGKVDGFVIVSSDSDFTRLAQRLRESGMLVVGMGRNQTSNSFRQACTTFVNIEHLSSLEDGAEKVTEEEGVVTTITLRDVERTVAGIVRYNDGRGEETLLGAVGKGLHNKYPDFDVRTFGYTKLTKMIADMPRFEIVDKGNVHYVVFADTNDVQASIAAFMRDRLAKEANNTMSLSQLANEVYQAFPNFKLKDVGYTQFGKYADSVKGLRVVGANRQQVRLVK
ncbi:MAG: NYN domain-containing protein [Atopobiaceae bacterium]|nr:NYN domain-containing protein [Atopobiaceae bacterium]